MASVALETVINVGADRAWALLREVGAAQKAFPGVLIDCQLDGDLRTVTFANGMAARERIVDIDEDRRRLAYGVVEGPFTHHSASIQIVEEAGDRCRFVWVSDFLPAALEAMVRPLATQGTEAFRRAAQQSS